MSAAEQLNAGNAFEFAKPTPIASVSLRDGEISIGPILPEDTGPMFLWMNDVAAANLDFAYRPVDWMAFKAWSEELSRSSTATLFAIRKVSHLKPIGFVLFKNIQAVHRSAELGIRIGDESERSKGYGRAATALALRYAWNHLDLKRVHLQVFAHNARALRAYRAGGFVEEGRLRQAAFIDGKWADIVLMASLNPAD